MKKLRLVTIALSLVLILSFALTACTQANVDEELEIKITVLNGTTGFGMAKLMNDAREDKATLNYNVNVDTDAANIHHHRNSPDHPAPRANGSQAGGQEGTQDH